MMVKHTHYIEKYFLFIILVLIAIGSIFIYSASTAIAIQLYGSSHYFAKKHFYGLLLGTGAYTIGRKISSFFVQNNAFFLWMCSLILTASTILSPYGVLIHGSCRWIRIGTVMFQPSEFLKMSFIICIASLLRHTHKKDFSYYASLITVCVLTAFVLLAQPDFGLTVTLLSTALLLFFFTSPRLFPVLILFSLFCIAALCLIMTASYRFQRVLTFLNPWKDPKGKGFQIIQSFIAIGSGGWWGKGFTHSKQKFFYLPMQHTDFIFSIIAEEIGFLGTTLLILLFLMLIWVGIKGALSMRNRFNALCTLGFTLLIGLQTFINISVALGLAPTKGIGLPFISYGNTNILCTLGMVGFIMNILHIEREQRYPFYT